MTCFWSKKMWFLTALLSLCSAINAHGWTTHSPLTAFKQLGFDAQSHQQSLPQNPSFIPYSISDFSDQKPEANKDQDHFQQIHHPNDILSNMGVDLPPEEILGKQKISTFCLFAGIYLRFVSRIAHWATQSHSVRYCCCHECQPESSRVGQCVKKGRKRRSFVSKSL